MRMRTVRVILSGRATKEGACAMNSTSVRTTFATMAVTLAAVCIFQTGLAQSSSTPSRAAAKPLLLEKNEGERRIWREPPPGDFILKVSPKNNGSQHLVMGTDAAEDLHG
jgi:hypothetical protein